MYLQSWATADNLIWGIVGLSTAGVIIRPFQWPEAVWALAGAALLLLLGLPRCLGALERPLQRGNLLFQFSDLAAVSACRLFQRLRFSTDLFAGEARNFFFEDLIDSRHAAIVNQSAECTRELPRRRPGRLTNCRARLTSAAESGSRRLAGDNLIGNNGCCKRQFP